MREKIEVLYYPDMLSDQTTLKKAILFFDEIHFMDRPSFSFHGGFGTIGAASPLRQLEKSFRDNGVPLFVHSPKDGSVEGDFLEQISADVNDLLFLTRFQDGLKRSETFRDLQIQHGNYGEVGTHENVARELISVDLSRALSTHETAIDLFTDSNIRPFDFSTSQGCAKTLISEAVVCSAKINFALDIGKEYGFIPLADATPYHDLLGAKYARAIKNLEPVKNCIQVTDLSFAIFDELIPSERLETMTMREIVSYRKASEKAREEFLEYLGLIQLKQAAIGVDGDLSGEIEKIVKTEIVPAVRTFKNKLASIDDDVYRSLAKGILGSIGGTGGINLFGDLSWVNIAAFSLASTYVGISAIEGFFAQRAVKRECSISYILSLDK